jgi:hypothetical protein
MCKTGEAAETHRCSTAFFAQSAAIAGATIGDRLHAAAHPSARRILRSAYLGAGRVNFFR